jgi:hypothetical protein
MSQVSREVLQEAHWILLEALLEAHQGLRDNERISV